MCSCFFFFFNIKCYFLVLSAILFFMHQKSMLSENIDAWYLPLMKSPLSCNCLPFFCSPSEYLNLSKEWLMYIAISSPPIHPLILCNLIPAPSTLEGGTWPLVNIIKDLHESQFNELLNILNICGFAAVFVTGTCCRCLEMTFFLSFWNITLFWFAFFPLAVPSYSLFLDLSPIITNL